MAPEHATGLPAHAFPTARPSKCATHEPPRVCSLLPPTPGHTRSPVSSWSPSPRPAASTLSSPALVLPRFQATPQRLNFSNAPSPRVVSEPQALSPRVVIEPWHLISLPPPALPTRKPISHCTRSRAPAPLALFTAGQPLHKCVTYHIPTAKSVWATAEPTGFAVLCKAMQPAEIDGLAYLCQALTQYVSGLEALLVLNPSTGEFLKNCQLCCDPRYKATWYTSYASELGWLCQGILLPTQNGLQALIPSSLSTTATSCAISKRKSATPWWYAKCVQKKMILIAAA
jgi:hypothetical protein